VFVDNEIKKGDVNNFELDKKQIIDALGKGRSFIVNNYLGSGTGFRFFAEYNGEQFTVGDEIRFDPAKKKKIIFRILLPSPSKIKLMHNGKCADEINGLDCIWDSDEKGNYRVEAWKDDKGWIFSNHIRVL
jgi:hypothetical protein